MSHELLSLNADLKRLRDEGYFVQIRGGFLVMREVPYLAASGRVERGTLISTLSLAGDRTCPPNPHTIFFDGEYPLDPNGNRIADIEHGSNDIDHGHGLASRHSFSCKPEGGYTDYHQKMTTYAGILGGPARTVEKDATARVYRDASDDADDSPFCYPETASDRVGIGALVDKLRGEHVGIIGLGGSGSYVLDFVAKTPVLEIRLFDDDEFLGHNAFRAPGAPSLEELRDAPLKVEYLATKYSNMSRRIVPYGVKLTSENLQLLDGITFAFLCMDAGKAKHDVVMRLEAMDVPFVDLGMGLELVDGSLGGILRTTTSTPGWRDSFHERVSYEEPADGGLYTSNIQIAELNAMNAALAVIKWKKLRGVYRDLEREHQAVYTTDGNQLSNGDIR